MSSTNWIIWAFGSALFAALTAIFAKVGVRDADPDSVTLFRTAAVLLILIVALSVAGRVESPLVWSVRTIVFVILSGFATAGSWFCYMRALKVGETARVVAIDKLSVVIVAVFAALFLQERLTISGWIGVGMLVGGALLLSSK